MKAASFQVRTAAHLEGIGPQAYFKGVEVSFELIDPDDARTLLSKSDVLGQSNRAVVHSRVERYASDMACGEWRITGDTISIDKIGRLLNGQHRLHAVIESGMAVPFIVCRGIENSAFEAMDQGRPRSLADVLSVSGHDRVYSLAAALRLLYVYENRGVEAIPNVNKMSAFTNEVGMDTARKHPGIVESIPYAESCKDILQAGIGIFCHYLLSLRDRALANDFFNRISDGQGIQLGDPVHTLRERLLRTASERRKNSSSIARAAVIYMVFTAWNATVDGRKITQIKVLENFSIPEPKAPAR